MIRKCFWVGVIILTVLVMPALVGADQLQDKQKEIEELEQKIWQLQGEQKTLGSTISYLNAKIDKTQAEIQKTNLELAQLQSDIATLWGQIAVLDVSLEQLTTLLINRIQAMYKHETTTNPLVLLFSSTGINDFFSRLRYFKLVQEHDRRIIMETERVRTNFDLQKQVKEQKQVEVVALQARLEKEKVMLASQQAAKQQLLLQTKNDEKKFQELLAKAVAELAAIQGIIAGRGTETEVGGINEGQKIAAIIPSASACSTGAHLHFEVAKDGVHQNPESYLQPTWLQYAYDTNQILETVNASGSWSWPLNDPIKINQIYGKTYWTKFLWYDFHTGIDMTNASQNYEVKAAQKGKLYRGSIGCRGGILQYVRVEQDNGINTYYLHVNYL